MREAVVGGVVDAFEVLQVTGVGECIQVAGQAGLKGLGSAKTAIFDPTAAFEYPVIDTDVPARGVPGEALADLFEVSTVVSSNQSRASIPTGGLSSWA